MMVAIARYVLHLPGARTLKDRRQVVRSFRDRVRARLSASIAEVGDLDRTQVATLGVAVVGRDAAHAHELLSAVTRMAEVLPDAVLADVATEVVPLGPGGKSLESALAARVGGTP